MYHLRAKPWLTWNATHWWWSRTHPGRCITEPRRGGWIWWMCFFSFFFIGKQATNNFLRVGRGSSLTCHKSPICLGKNPAGSLDNHNLKLCDHRLGYAKQIDSWRFRWKAMATEGRRHEFACWNGHITSCFLGTLRIQQRFLHHVSGVGERVNLESSISTTLPFTDQPYGNERRHYVAQANQRLDNR